MEEKAVALRIFKDNIENRKLTSFKEIQKAIANNPVLSGRTLPQIKTWVYNQFSQHNQDIV